MLVEHAWQVMSFNCDPHLVQFTPEIVKNIICHSDNVLTLQQVKSSPLYYNLQLFDVCILHAPQTCLAQIGLSNMKASLIAMLNQIVSFSQAEYLVTIPNWLCYALMTLDFCHMYSFGIDAHQQVLQKFPQRQWMFLESNKWLPFESIQNKLVDDSYRNGAATCQFLMRQTQFIMLFSSMYMYSRTEHTYRIVTWIPKSSANQDFDTPESNSTQLSLTDTCSKTLLETLVFLIKLPQMNQETIQAILRLCIRLTRDHSNACHFAQLGGISALLAMNSKLHFEGIETMVIIIIRHVYENQTTLTKVMKSTIRDLTLSSNRGQHVLCRYMAPLEQRNPTLFANIAKDVIRFDIEKPSSEKLLRFNNDNSILQAQEQCLVSKELTIKLLNLLPVKFAQEHQEENTVRPLFTSRTILIILAEVCRFYKPAVQMVFEHRFREGNIFVAVLLSYLFNIILFKGIAPMITSECSVVEWILDAQKTVPFWCPFFFKYLVNSESHLMTPKLLAQISSAFKKALYIPDTAHKYAWIQETCAAATTILEHTGSSGNKASLLKILEDTGLASTITLAMQSFDWSSTDFHYGVNAILSLLNCMSNNINSVPESKSQHLEAIPGDDEMEQATDASQISDWRKCPILHPSLLKMRTEFVRVEYFQHCRPLSSPVVCPFVNLANGNDIIIFHNELSRHRTVPCSSCRWFQEWCLTESTPYMHDAMPLILPQLEQHWNKMAKFEQNEKTKQAQLLLSPAQPEPQVSKTRIDAKSLEKLVKNVVDQTKLSKDFNATIVKEKSKEPKTKESPKDITTVYKLTIKQRAILGNEPLPDELDPAVLVELPDDIRREVIAEARLTHNRKMQQQKQIQTKTTDNTNQHLPEVLIELPANVRAEVLAQQRTHREVTPVSPADHVIIFLQSLQPEMRRQVLSEMDDTQLQHLPDYLVAEVRALRLDAVNRINETERYDQPEEMPRRFTPTTIHHQATKNQQETPVKFEHKLLNEQELSSLLVLQFVQNLPIQWNTYHSLIQSLCVHSPTRNWVTRALLDLIEQTTMVSDEFKEEKWVIMPGATFWSSIEFKLKDSTTTSIKQRAMWFTEDGIHINSLARHKMCSNALYVLHLLASSFPDLWFPSVAPISQATFSELLVQSNNSSTFQTIPESSTNSGHWPQSYFPQMVRLIDHPVVATSEHLTMQIVQLLQMTFKSKLLTQQTVQDEIEKTVSNETNLKSILDVLFSKCGSKYRSIEVKQLLILICSKYKAACLITHKFVVDNVAKLTDELLENLIAVCAELTQFSTEHNQELGSLYLLVNCQKNFQQQLSLVIQIRLLCLEKTEQMKKYETEQIKVDKVWSKLSECLVLLNKSTIYQNQYLLMLPLIEAFFMINAPSSLTAKRIAPEPLSEQLAHINQSANKLPVNEVDLVKSDQATTNDSEKNQLIDFITTNRITLNGILRKAGVGFLDNRFSAMLDHNEAIDFDVKQKYLQAKLSTLNRRINQRPFVLRVKRSNIFEDSFRQLERQPTSEWKRHFRVIFNGEEGQDAGGLLREWYTVIARDIFNPNYGNTFAAAIIPNIVLIIFVIF